MPERREPWGSSVKQQQVSLALDHMIGRGLFKASPQKVTAISSALGPKTTMKDVQTWVVRLLLVAGGEPAQDDLKLLAKRRTKPWDAEFNPAAGQLPADGWLTPAAEGYLELFRVFDVIDRAEALSDWARERRAGPKPRGATGAEARERAAQLLFPEEDWTQDDPDGAFRRRGGAQQAIVHELAARAFDLLHPTSDDEGAQGREAPSAPSSSYEASNEPGTTGRARLAAAAIRGAETPEERKYFWQRPSTERAIAKLAEEPPLTIYAGADGASDVGQPVHTELFEALIAQRASRLSSPYDERSIGDALKAYAAQHPRYLGSTLRDLYQPETRAFTRSAERSLEQHLRDWMEAHRVRGGFIARAVTYLAFELADKNWPGSVMTAHLDEDFTDAAADRRKVYAKRFGDMSFVEEDLPHPPRLSKRTIPLVRVHGRRESHWPQSLAIGEADFIANPGIDGDPRPQPSRYSRLVTALTSGPILFVGTSLRDPALISALAETADSRHLRYAIVNDVDQSDPTSAAAAAERWLVARRYLHLGVVPIIVDLQTQIPQFIREIALLIDRQEDYEPYGHRLDQWWNNRRSAFGFDGDASRRGEMDPTLAEEWFAELQAVRSKCGGAAEGSDANERFRVDAWVRNPRTRGLFRCASSDRRQHERLDDFVPIAASSRLPARAFRLGHSVEGPLAGHDARGSWAYGVAFNVIHYKKGARLPVGTVTICSSQAEGRLRAFAEDGVERGDFEDEVGRALEPLIVGQAAKFDDQGSTARKTP